MERISAPKMRVPDGPPLGPRGGAGGCDTDSTNVLSAQYSAENLHPQHRLGIGVGGGLELRRPHLLSASARLLRSWSSQRSRSFVLGAVRNGVTNAIYFRSFERGQSARIPHVYDSRTCHLGAGSFRGGHRIRTSVRTLGLMSTL